MSIVTLFVIMLGVFVLVKYSEINDRLTALQQDAQHFVRIAKQDTNAELRGIQQTAEQTAQQTKQRLNRSFDSYRRKLSEIDKKNAALLKKWEKEFNGMTEEFEERIALKEQELDKLITAYQSKLENLDELPPPPLVEGSIPDSIKELWAAGNSLSGQQSYGEAISQYKKAVDLLLEKAPQKKEFLSSLYTRIAENSLNIYFQTGEETPDAEMLEQAKKYASQAMAEDSTNALAPYLLARVLNEYDEASDDFYEYLAKALDNDGATIEMVLNDFPNMEKDERFQEFIDAYRKSDEP